MFVASPTSAHHGPGRNQQTSERPRQANMQSICGQKMNQREPVVPLLVPRQHQGPSRDQQTSERPRQASMQLVCGLKASENTCFIVVPRQHQGPSRTQFDAKQMLAQTMRKLKRTSVDRSQDKRTNKTKLKQTSLREKWLRLSQNGRR